MRQGSMYKYPVITHMLHEPQLLPLDHGKNKLEDRMFEDSLWVASQSLCACRMCHVTCRVLPMVRVVRT